MMAPLGKDENWPVVASITCALFTGAARQWMAWKESGTDGHRVKLARHRKRADTTTNERERESRAIRRQQTSVDCFFFFCCCCLIWPGLASNWNCSHWRVITSDRAAKCAPKKSMNQAHHHFRTVPWAHIQFCYWRPRQYGLGSEEESTQKESTKRMPSVHLSRITSKY